MSQQMHKHPSSTRRVAKGASGLSSWPSNTRGHITPPPFRSTFLQNPRSDAIHDSSTRLYTFLQSDVEANKGHHRLPPFFTTNDLLHLSECSKGLRQYHHLLAHVKLEKHQRNSRCDEEDVMRLLSNQRSGLLSRLHLGDVSLVHIFNRHQAWGRFTTLKVLELPDLDDIEEGVPAMHGLGEALSQGRLRNLEELRLARWPAEDDTLLRMLITLGEGACPNLCRLQLTGDSSFEARGRIPRAVIATAFGSGHLKRLQALDLEMMPCSGVLAVLSHQLRAGCCPDLRELTLSGCMITLAVEQAFGQALRSGACLTLEKLEVNFSFILGSSLFLPVLEALEVGSCPELKRLALKKVVNFTDVGGASLGDAFSEGIGILPVLHALKQRVHPHLRYLNLVWNDLDAEKGRALGEALGNGALPNLEELLLSCNEELGDEGVVAIMRGLQLGKSPGLTRLAVDSVGMGQQGAAAMCQAMMAGSIRNLKSLNISFNSSIGDEGMTQIRRAIDMDSCPSLEEFLCFRTDANRKGCNTSDGVCGSDSWYEEELEALAQKLRNLGFRV